MRRLAVTVVLSAGFAACQAPPPALPQASAPPPAPGGPLEGAGAVVASNVLRADYAGSRACADCHGAIFAAWESSAMRGMTRDARTAVIRAPFDGATLRVGPDTCTMAMQNGERVMRVVVGAGRDAGTHVFRITKVVGGRYREDFVGRELSGGREGDEHVLPATYVFATRSWRYKGYSVMVKERPRMATTGRWSRECLPCHNTLPLATMLYDDLDPSVPSYQGKLSDRVLPRSKLWPARATDAPGLARALGDEIAFLGNEPPAGGDLHTALSAAAIANQQHLDGPHVVELGVGCEACHNGARAHTGDPDRLPTFAVKSPLVAVAPPHGQAGTRAQWINHTCAKCHTVLFTHYEWTWEGGVRSKNPGGSSISSGEGRDYQLGGCASQMACTTCHDPHATDARDKLARLATPAGNATCTTCHAAYAGADAVARHAHHPAGSAGASCVACHMPKKNMGLDYGLMRYHRIGSPSEPRRVEGDRPIECALCHADKSVEGLVSTIEQWWGKRYDRGALRALYGDDLSVNALRATLARGKPHEQAVAIAVLGEASDASAIPLIAGQLDHEYPLVRYFAQRALETLTGAPVAIDVGAPAAEVRRAAADWLRSSAATHR
ncbi:MAG TPA: cytochrome c3 family protein [Kofleriaceae bacterium]|nr:cytochrome c3 family protein [Kofleriaceae bacterium]